MNRFSLSGRLFLLLTILLTFPALGWLLLSQQEAKVEQNIKQQNLEQTQFYQSLFNRILVQDPTFLAGFEAQDSNKEMLVAKATSSILIDGYGDDWYPYKVHRAKAYNSQQASYFGLVEDENFLYGLFEIEDASLVYKVDPFTSTGSDAIRLDLGTGSWLFQTLAPGKVNVLRDEAQGFKVVSSIYAIWQETRQGYNLEFRLPKALVGNYVSATLYDHDAKDQQTNPSHQGVFSFTNFSTLNLSRQQDDSWLTSNSLPHERITLLNKQGQVIQRIGQLFSSQDSTSFWLKDNAISVVDVHRNSKKIDNNFIRKAIQQGFNQEQSQKDTIPNIVRSASSLENRGQFVGTLLLESSALNQKLQLRNYYLFAMLVFIGLWLLVTVLVIKNSRDIKRRIGRLVTLTEQSYANDLSNFQLDDELINEELAAVDEVAELYQSVYYFNDKLKQQDEHQQKMLARMNHELRTPIAIIRSSIDNLSLAELDSEDQHLVATAQSGISRLSSGLSRLSEASLLEQSIKQVATNWFELTPLLTNLVDAYRQTWPEQVFELKLDKGHFKLKGSEELFAQMLDKIISNAVDFAEQSSPITITLSLDTSDLLLKIRNTGPLIEKERLKSVFNLMESKRAISNNDDNLGLGLFIAKMIAHKHKAKIFAVNCQQPDGVLIKLLWHKNKYVVS